jgi:predicted TIM-barrel fold metal-dependent hydrolase
MNDELPIPIEEINRRFCSLEELHPGRMFAFFGVDPRRPNAAALFASALEADHPPVGLKIYASTGFYPYDEVCRPLYGIATEREIPVLFETGVVGAPMRPRFARPSFLIDVAADFPAMPIIVGHVGRSAWWEEALATARGCPSMRLDLSGWWQERRKLGEGTLIRDLGRLRDEIGPHRLQWGTDRSSGPSRSGDRSTWPEEIAWWRDLRAVAARHDVTFTTEEVDMILGENAAGLLRKQGRLPSVSTG